MATLATSDRNKPLLVDFVEQLLRAIELRSDNRRATRFAVVALLQLSFEPKCTPKFQQLSDRLNISLNNIINTFPEEEIETKRNAQVLLATINEGGEKGPAERRKSGSRFFKAVRTVMGNNAAGAAGHVMISYQWDSQPVAIELEKRLSEAGVKTWFDLNDVSCA